MNSSMSSLLTIMKQLRDPKSGCEWDKVQTFESIKPHTLEETYEVFDAIDRKDYKDLKSELGDLLYQIVFYSQMASENNYFTFDDVAEAICDKLINRHPHIFSQPGTNKPNWEQIKQKERDKKQQYSLLDDIPNAMPALMRAEKVQKRCASVGFDWDSLMPVWDKVKEELQEVEDELNKNPQEPLKIEEEVGDLFFAMVNLTRHLGLKSEMTLQKATQKFERRFKQVEQVLKMQHIELSKATLEQMEDAWQQVKQQEINH